MRELNKGLRADKVSVRDRQLGQVIPMAADEWAQERFGETVGVTRVTVFIGADVSSKRDWSG